MSLRRSAYAPPAPKMPPGLIELMDGLARDVLKHNPDNIFEFCAHHMQTLLKMRDGHNAPKPLLTLEQKIFKAQEKINQRAEQRRRQFDEKLQLTSSENVNKQHVLTNNIADERESPEVKEIENKSIDIKDVTEGTIHSIELKEVENSGSDNSNDVETNKEATLQTCVDDEIKEGKEASDEDTLDVIDSDASKIVILAKEDDGENVPATNDTIEHLENSLSEENRTVTTTELTDLDTESKDKNDVNNTVISTETTIEQQLDNNTVNDEKMSTEQDGGHVLDNEGAESSEMNVQTEPDDNAVKDANDEILTDHITEKVILSPVDNTKASDNAHTVLNEGPTDVLPENGTINENGDEIVPITETKNDSFEKPMDSNESDIKQEDDGIISMVVTKKESFENHSEDLNESEIKQEDDGIVSTAETKNDSFENPTEDSNPEIKQEDDKILAVILSINSPESVLVESNEPDHLQNNGSNQKVEILDFENAPESTDDKSRNMNSSMDLETAAITIQKVFRSFLFKTKTASYDDPTTVDMNLLNEDKEKEDSNGINIKDRRLLGISRMDTVLQTVNEEKSLSLSTDDSSTLSSAATIIQAHVRGFLVRNKFNSNKTTSTNSLVDSDAPSIPSLEADSDNRKSKTVLNIHIVPEGGHYVSRDESILTSMDLSLDSSPPSSVNLHPLGYDKSERRKLKREDAIQSVSPPSNNSGKLSDDVDSEKEVLTPNNNTALGQTILEEKSAEINSGILTNGVDKVATKVDDSIENPSDAADEMDVITPFVPIEGRSSRESENSSKLLHSGEFHDIVIPTTVTRSDTSVVREFQNVLVYFILWNN